MIELKKEKKSLFGRKRLNCKFITNSLNSVSDNNKN